MATEHAEAFEYDTVGERAISLAHHLAGRRSRPEEELAALGAQAGPIVVAELAETVSQGFAAIAMAVLATGRAIARAADGDPAVGIETTNGDNGH